MPVGLFVLVACFPVPRRAIVTGLVLARRMTPRLLARLRIAYRDQPRGRALRLAFEDLGPAYIKFGQIIASSPTAFPPEVTDEFSRCLDEVRPIPEARIWRILRRELGRPPEEVFAEIDPVPLASASIAQVHAARLRDGSDVVIKVQRPGIRGRVEVDLRLLRVLAGWASRWEPELARANLTGIVEDFRKTIVEEMDFLLEAKNIEDFSGLLEREGLGGLAHAPKVYREHSTGRVLTMERLYGARIDDKDGVDARVADVVQMLRDTSEVFWSSVFLGGFFHGDIHAGNIMALDDGRLGYLDFGIFGRFGMNERIALSDWVGALVAGDGERLARSMARMGAVSDGVDWEVFVADVEESFLPLRALTVDNREMLEDFFPKLRHMAAKHDLHLPQGFVLICKQLAYFGRYVMIHHPSYNENLDPAMQKTFLKIFTRFHALRRKESTVDDGDTEAVA